MKFRTAALAIAALLALLFAACGSDDDDGGPHHPLSDAVESELVVDAAFPVAIAFTPDGRLFYNELLTGRIRIVTPDGQRLDEPFAEIEVATPNEGGLLGLAVDPEFAENGYIYVYFTAPAGDSVRPTVMRFTDVNGRGEEPTVILELPQSFSDAYEGHFGGNIHFGPDGYLYVTVGDYHRPALAQDLSLPMGKVLRINKEDGSAPRDNPFFNREGADPRVFAYGLRNSFDFAFHLDTGHIYATENLDENCDHLNLVKRGRNYGWPDSARPTNVGRTVVCQKPPAAEEAIYYFSRDPYRKPGGPHTSVAPTGIGFVYFQDYPRLDTSMLICEFNTALMRRYFLEGELLNVVTDGSVVVDDCTLDITIDNVGIVYYSNEREIRRLVPLRDEE